ncbi:hypothetical protein GCM10010435_39420 [Winogradskya consettensis]|uniref:Uncharacterized protein n=1 Tax=Winogradskya consettensis TaxID=113560 RepID=A0A919SBE5_9ACTN|nr:hypothetical protein [Actinoplanes consettensis]GIM69509.1 hypothetical protein Aco04nite_15550 [Actinoplanes consettensis]
MQRMNIAGGVALEVTARPQAGLRFEVGGQRRMVLRQGDAVVMLGSVDRHHYGVDIYRTGAYRSPIAPITAVEARERSVWLHWFATALSDAGTGPLHDGSWLLEEGSLPSYVLRGAEIRDFPSAYLDWFGGWHDVVPLGELAGEGDGRVKAYRKLVRDRILPPLLVWWASGLAGWVLLDGRARLAAALLEGVRPPIVVLSRRENADERQLGFEHAARRFESVIRSQPEAFNPLVRALADTHAHIERSPGRTRAWPLAGGEQAWRSLAGAASPKWLAETDAG